MTLSLMAYSVLDSIVLLKPICSPLFIMNAISTPVIAIDIPSGLNADTGCPMPVAMEAVITVTMVAVKAGMVTGQAKQFTGDIVLADLGVGNHLYKEISAKCTLARIIQLPLLPSRQINTYKTHAGKLLCVGGNQFMPGAIQLTVTAGYRMGCGMVKVATHPAHQYHLTAKQPEVMLVDNQHLETAIKWAYAVVLGPDSGSMNGVKHVLILPFMLARNIKASSD